MSSGNLISIVYTKEPEYGTAPDPIPSVVLETAVRTNDSLSGTPETTESQNARTDRMSNGQVVTGLDVGGSIDFELAPGIFWDDFFSGAMMNDWVPEETLSTDVTLTPDPADNQRATLVVTGDLSTIGVEEKDVLQLLPASGPPVCLSVISVTSTTELEVATERGQPAITAEAMDVAKPAHLDIGTTPVSFRIGKSYLDVQHDSSTDNKSQTYGLSLIHISEPTRLGMLSRMPSSA